MAVQTLLMHICLVGTFALLTWCVALTFKEQIALTVLHLLDKWRRLGNLGRALLVTFVSAMIVYGSTKTNAPPLTGSASMLGVGHAQYEVPQPETGRVPTGAVLAQNQWRRGCWEDWLSVSFDDNWVFPYGTNHLSRVAVMTQGELRTGVRDTDAIASLGAKVAHVPFDTCFYHEHTPSNSYRFTWDRAYIERDTNMPMYAAIELFRNGHVSVSTNGVSIFTPREIPFPHVGIGQNDDWVRTNFVNAAEILAVGYANWVDEQVGVDLENGLYKFTATFPEDPPEATQLTVGDLSVCVTNAGEYVFVLEKGVEYTFGTTPYDATVEYSMQDDVGPDAEIVYPAFSIFNSPFPLLSWWDGDTPGEWTVDGGWHEIVSETLESVGRCIFMPTFCGSPDILHVGPDNCEIVFEACLIDAPLGGSISYNWTCDNENVVFDSPHSSTTAVRFLSMPNWRKTSICVEALIGTNVLQSVLSSFSYGTNTVPSPAAVSVSFSKPFVVFEGDRMVAPGITVLRTSTGTRLTCSACGGENGGQVDFAFQGRDKVIWVSGSQLPYTKNLEPGEDISFDIVLEGINASEELEDIVATGTLHACDKVESSEARLTSVRASTYTHCSWIPFQHRKRVGVNEQVTISLEPVEAERQATITGCDRDGDFLVYTAPGHAMEDTVSIDLQSVHYDVVFSVIEPECLAAVDCQKWSTEGIDTAGGIKGLFTVAIFPTNVSFTGIQEMEVPCVSTNAVGYFAQPECRDILDHGKKGAGKWHGVGQRNLFFDDVSISAVPRPWGNGGSFTWPIPNAWRVAGDNAVTNLFSHRSSYDQGFELQSNGTVSISKFNHVLMRGTNTTDVSLGVCE